MKFVGTGKRLAASDYGEAAKLIGASVATIRGVVDVEAAGKGFDAANRPKILPEPHIFYKRLGPGAKRDKAVKLGVAYAKWGTKPYPKTSDLNYDRLAVMMSIDEKIALESVSWGLFQIMGFNFKDAGFASAAQMVEAFKLGEAEQLEAFVTLVKAWGLADELQRRDADGYAEKYNGPGYKKNGYGTKLRQAWKRHDQDRPMPVSNEVPTETRSAEAVPDAQAPIDEQTTILRVQKRLKDLGYVSVGEPDGKMGPSTEGAILAFRNDNGLPAVPTIDQELLTAIETAAPKPVDPQRAAATVAEVMAKPDSAVAAPLKANWWQKVVAGGIAGPAVIGGVVDNIGGATEKLGGLKDFIGDIPSWVWLVLVITAAAGIYLMARHSDHKTIEAYRTGAVT